LRSRRCAVSESFPHKATKTREAIKKIALPLARPDPPAKRKHRRAFVRLRGFVRK
jgi:hypothetical protein